MMKTTEQFVEEALAEVGTDLGTNASTQGFFGELFAGVADWLTAAGCAKPETLLPPLVRSGMGAHPFSEPNVWLDGDVPAWDNLDEMRATAWPQAWRFQALRRFATEGIFNPTFEGKDSSYDVQLGQELRWAEHLLPLLPVQWIRMEHLSATYHHLWIVFAKARARSRLDNGEDISFTDVVLLSGMAAKSVRNATQQRHGSRRLRVSDNDTVKYNDAVAWLLERKTFIATPNASYEAPEKPHFDADDVMFVPATLDGRAFEPTSVWCSPPGPLYYVRIEGKDSYFDNYFEALEAMTVAKTFSWSFRDGEPSLAKGWKRMSKTELRRQEKQVLEERRHEAVAYQEDIEEMAVKAKEYLRQDKEAD